MGKPGSGNTESSGAEYIGAEKRTGGTETSQYPEEQKATAIPSVVASERGTAQTIRYAKPVRVVSMGSRVRAGRLYGAAGKLQNRRLIKLIWKGHP